MVHYFSSVMLHTKVSVLVGMLKVCQYLSIVELNWESLDMVLMLFLLVYLYLNIYTSNSSKMLRKSYIESSGYVIDSVISEVVIGWS